MSEQKLKSFRKFHLTLWVAGALFWAGCVSPQVYFSPHGGTEERIVSEINRCRHSVDAAVYSLTSPGIAKALVEAEKRGVKVRLVMDRVQSKGRYSQLEFLEAQGVSCKTLSGKGGGLMHHKFAVFDGETLITGSHNWTEGAEEHNHENTLVIHDKALSGNYEQEFQELWAE